MSLKDGATTIEKREASSAGGACDGDRANRGTTEYVE